MITPSDSFYTYDLGKYYIILPATHNWSLNDFKQKFAAKKVEEGFTYNSGNNQEWETIETLRALIKEHVDPFFS